MRPRAKPVGDVIDFDACGKSSHGELLYWKRCLWCKRRVKLSTRTRFCSQVCGSKATGYRKPVQLFTPEVVAKRTAARRRAVEVKIAGMDPVEAYRKGYKSGYIAGYGSGKYGRHKADKALLRGELGDNWPKREKAS